MKTPIIAFTREEIRETLYSIVHEINRQEEFMEIESERPQAEIDIMPDEKREQRELNLQAAASHSERKHGELNAIVNLLLKADIDVYFTNNRKNALMFDAIEILWGVGQEDIEQFYHRNHSSPEE